MAGGLIGALRVTLGIDTAAFESGSARARKKAVSDATAITRAYGGMKTAVSGLLAGISIGALVAVTSRALEYASSLAEVAQQLGVTTKDLQEYRYAASQVGISQEEMDKGLSKLTLTMGKARAGVKEPVAAFNTLSNILGKDILKSAATAGDAIPLISDALVKVKDPAARAAIEVGLFGKTGQKLDTLLAQGSAAIDGLRNAAQRLGLVLSEEQIRNADDTADKLSEVKQILEANIAGAVANNADAILSLADAFAALVVQAGQAAEAYGNFQNLQGYKQGDMASGAALAKTKSGRATLINYLDEKLAQNTKDRATGRGGRTNYLGGLVQVTGNADAASNKKLDDEFKRYTKARNAAVHLDNAVARVAALPKPVKRGGNAGAGSSPAQSKRAPKDQSDKRNERFNSEMSSLEDEQLRLQSDQTNSLEARTVYAQRRIANDAEAYQLELASKVKEGELLPEQARKLAAAKAFNIELEAEIERQRSADDLAREALATKDASFGLQSDLLRGELDEAKSQGERRKLQLQLLDIEYDRQRAALESVLALNSSTDAEKEIARARLAQLDALKGHEQEGVRRDTSGPLEQFRDGLHRTAGQIQEDFEKIEVDGIEALNDGLIDAILNAQSLGDVFNSVAKQIVSDLLKIGLQEAESAIFGGKGKTGGGGIGGIIAGFTSIFGGKSFNVGLNGGSIAAGNAAALSTIGLPHLAGGGAIKIGGKHGLDTNLLSINGMPSAMVNRGETIRVDPANDGGRGGHFIIEPSPWFDVRAAGAAQPGIQSMGARAAAGGAQLANTNATKAARRRLGR